MEAQEQYVDQGGEQPAEAPPDMTTTQPPPPPAAAPPPEPPQEQGPPPWVDQLERSFADRLGQVASEIGSRLSPLEQALQQQPEPQEPYDDLYGGYYDDQPQVDQNQIMAQVEQLVGERMAPLIEERREEMFDALMEEFPELQTEEGAAPTAQAVQEEAARLRQPELADDPRFARLVHVALQGQGAMPSEEVEGAQQPEGESVFQRMHREDRESPTQTMQDQITQNDIDRIVAERLAPVIEEQRENKFADLMEEFPALASEEGAAPVVQMAQEAAERYGNPGLAGDPHFVRMVYLAMNGEERAAGETPAGDGSKVALEQGGATPAEPEPDHLFQQLWQQKQRTTLNWDR